MKGKVTGAMLEEAEEIGRAALGELLDDGLDSEEALDVLAALLDVLTPLRALLPPPLGDLAEAQDGPAYRAALAALSDILRLDPERVALRAERAAARGHFAVAARRRKRAARLLSSD